MTEVELQSIKDKLKNKQKIRLLFPYSENSEVKKLGARWDSEIKIWYYPSLDGKVPEELEKYLAKFIDVEYDDKDYLKPLIPSMKFDKITQHWMCNNEDYIKFATLMG